VTSRPVTLRDVSSAGFARPVWAHAMDVVDRRWTVPVALSAALFVLYTFDSVHRYEHFGNGAYDLGLFVQNIRGWASFTGPISAIKGPGFNLLGDHFSPILALLAPLWWVWPSPVMLLVVQSLLMALGVLPLMLWARRDLGLVASLVIGLAYGLSFGVLNAVNFDFHEIAFAVPIVSLSVTLLGTRRHRMALIAAAPLVLVKEDLGVTYIAALGLVLLLRREWLLGAIALVGGITCSLLAISVVIPAFNPHGVYAYASQVTLDPGTMFRQIADGFGMKVFTVFAVLAISIFVAVRSPLIILVFANLVPRLLSSRQNDYSPFFHYNAITVALVVAAMIDALVHLRGEVKHPRAFLGIVLAGSLVVTGVLWGLLQIPSYGVQLATSAQSATFRSAISRIPRGATVLATNQLVPHLAVNHDVAVFSMPAVRRYSPDWIVAESISLWPEKPAERRASLQELEHGGYLVAYAHDGVLVLRRDR
jgi:uncharacterized membrane protein